MADLIQAYLQRHFSSLFQEVWTPGVSLQSITQSHLAVPRWEDAEGNVGTLDSLESMNANF